MKAVNTAVDLIVAHFGTSRDPDVKVGVFVGSGCYADSTGWLKVSYVTLTV